MGDVQMTVMAQTDFVKAISELAAEMPVFRVAQLYEFALFLQSRPLPEEETLEDILADEALWDAQFAATDDAKLAELVAAVEAEIDEGKTTPMFDSHGNFQEYP